MSTEDFAKLLGRIAALIEAAGGTNVHVRIKGRATPSGAVYCEVFGMTFCIIFQPMYDITVEDMLE